jgi:hypothetical protein
MCLHDDSIVDVTVSSGFVIMTFLSANPIISCSDFKPCSDPNDLLPILSAGFLAAESSC